METVSANGSRRSVADEGPALQRFPQYELECLFDEDDAPNEVTVFVDDVGELATCWITIDIEHAVPLEDVR